jgi:hypothetical protein
MKKLQELQFPECALFFAWFVATPLLMYWSWTQL